MEKRCVNCKKGFEGNRKALFCSEKCKKDFSKQGLVTTADKISAPIAEKLTDKDLDELIETYNENKKAESWITEIEKYCDMEGVLPQDLIDAHRNQNKPKFDKKQGKEVKVQDLTKPPNSNWRKEYIKNKTGITL